MREVRVRVSRGGMAYLLFLAARGGEADFDGSKVEPKLRRGTMDGVARLVAAGVLTATPLAGHPNVAVHRLTDLGRKAVEAYKSTRRTE